jgi:cytochrome oxidase Cu insertion factor (SCO1/SenC/PrrC family)
MWLSVALLAGCASATPAEKAPAAEAAPAPAARKAADFTLTDTDGKQVSLHDLLKSGPVVLAFFPKAFTGG